MWAQSKLGLHLSTKPGIERRILVLPDTHAPYHSQRAVALALKCTREYKPDTIIALGDWLDCYSVSDYPKHPDRRGRLQYEVEAGAKLLKPFRAECDEFYFTEGNHENRLERYLSTRAPELYGLISMRELLDLNAAQYTKYQESKKIGKVYFTHDVGFCGAGAAAKSLAAFGGNLVFGHSHKPELVYDRNLRGESHFCMNAGWLGDPAMIDYAHKRKARGWQHGLGLVEQTASGESWATFVPFVKGKAVIAEKVVSL